MARFYCPVALATGAQLSLPEGAARHVQVLRLQPGDAITLFNGEGGEHQAVVLRMGRSEVLVQVGAHLAVEREPARAVTLAVGMPANERMDWLVEKATELGVSHIQPLLTERCVLRLKGERADKKVAHWQAVAIAACEQSGRNRVPQVAPVMELPAWLQAPSQHSGARWVLSLRDGVVPARHGLAALAGPLCVAVGPEGGFTGTEEDRLLASGFAPVSLGLAVLRAETAALAAMTLAAG